MNQNAKIVLLGKFFLICAEIPNNIWDRKHFIITEKLKLLSFIKEHNINITNKDSFSFLN
jgi:hypothetical protein